MSQREKLNKAITETVAVMTTNAVTGQEYLFILQTMAAQALAENPKPMERQFIEHLRADVLARRLESLRRKKG